MSAALYAKRPAHTNFTAALGAILIAGVVGLVFWELWIRFGAPVATGKFPLDGPVGLAQAVLNKTFGLNAALGGATARSVAEALHYFAAFIGYPLGYALAARPIAQRVNRLAPIAPFWLVGLIYGAALFVFAGYVMGHLVAGFPPFFGLDLGALALNPALFGGEGSATPLLKGAGLPVGSLIGHMLLGLGVAIGYRAVAGR